jgi:hypothetical protein
VRPLPLPVPRPIVNKSSPVGPDQLRKDYAYLFERFYLLDDLKPSPNGIVVGDSRQAPARACSPPRWRTTSASRRAACQRRRPRRPRAAVRPRRAGRRPRGGVDRRLTSWGFHRELVIPERRELAAHRPGPHLRFRVVRDMGDNPNCGLGFSVIHDLRMREDREGLEA